ncbi:MAG: undecaprenyldiphospho-muramoylpentapeptide beta-N-acetylglucosaminyltransferase [Flavobacteriales bacterium]|nr:undecaprenyldiphospho-muramoylpentapeptide beta-N-acetylglucosaminyltransferase [Candidatus Arcticimaribacter sp.]
MKPFKFIISGGGTGGHIYPAIAIADALGDSFSDTKFLFVGAKGKMEMEKIPKAGYTIKGIWISGLQRGSFFKNILFPLKLIVSFFQSALILLRFRPNFVIGTGGFASGPILLIAHYFKIKTLIQEQNSYAGITNKILGKRVDVIAVAFPNMDRFFPENKISLTGNPVRKALLEVGLKREQAFQFFKLDSSKKTLVVLGGSLGADRINQVIESHLSFFSDLGIQLIWQCGKLYYDQFQKHNKLNHVQVHAFLQEMDLLYAASDLIISRAGASSVSELALVGKPVLLIPSPNVAENHQYHNAKFLANSGGAFILSENDLKDQFKESINQLMSVDEKDVREKLSEFARPNATQDIVLKITQELKV